MKEHERIILTGVFSVLVLSWLGFLVHSSPHFAGSGTGAVFGIAGAVLMLVPLAYPIAKRIAFLHDRITAHVSLQSLMTLHVYSGILGPLLAIIHTGHKYDSWLGITLTAVMLLVVVSGFALRYLLTYVNQEIKDKLLLLQTARGDLDSAWGVLENSPEEAKALPKARLLTAGLASLGIDLSTTAGPAREVTRLAESVADLEYAIRTHEFFKRWFSRALTLHIVLSVLFYVLLGLHIWAGIHFGLRWFS
ncbi:MAG: hypothetical protein ACYC6N_12490 [Pirellulaceae bacterium]